MYSLPGKKLRVFPKEKFLKKEYLTLSQTNHIKIKKPLVPLQLHNLSYSYEFSVSDTDHIYSLESLFHLFITKKSPNYQTILTIYIQINSKLPLFYPVLEM